MIRLSALILLSLNHQIENYITNLRIFGKKRKTPTRAAKVVVKNTAAAETSLATLAFSEISGLTRSTRVSREVFISSSTSTRKIVKTRIIHS